MEYETQDQPATLLKAMEEMGITIESKFVPWSQSRYYTNKDDCNSYNHGTSSLCKTV